MRRVQVQLTEEQLEALRQHAESTGAGIAAGVREALDEWIARAKRDDLWDQAMEVVGKYHSGLGDLGENHDDYLGDRSGW